MTQSYRFGLYLGTNFVSWEKTILRIKVYAYLNQLPDGDESVCVGHAGFFGASGRRRALAPVGREAELRLAQIDGDDDEQSEKSQADQQRVRSHFLFIRLIEKT